MVETLKPDTTEQVREAVAWASGEETPVEIVGTGTKRGFGRPMGDGNRTIGHVLDLSALSGITLYEPEELVLSAWAGTPLADIEAAVADKGQMLAFEPPALAGLYGEEGGTLGGMIACNLAGPRRIRAGAARDHILGIEAVTGRGDIVKSGGRVVKNVTGYDLSKLLTGSFGTLAALTQITIKVLPAPETTATMIVSGQEPDDAVRAMAAAQNSSHEVSGAAYVPTWLAEGIPGVESSATAVRIEGFAPSVDARSRALQDLLAPFGDVSTLDNDASMAFWRAVRDVGPFSAGDGPLWRISGTPTEAANIVAASGGSAALIDWGGGLIWCESDDAAAVRAAVANNGGGHATLVRASEGLRRSVPVFEPQPAALAALSTRVKESFDPRHILNPGRMYEGV
ncbi:MAG: glycolate oxidase subunit GlcE [Alphaproteobacteria bacterium]|nr:glycolate oxidase subunit GlcE [Alphaproteobacteria bacterium]